MRPACIALGFLITALSHGTGGDALAVDAESVPTWTLCKLVVEEEEIKVPDNASITISLSDKSIASGFSGVNRFYGRYRIDKSSFRWISAIRSTRRAGSKELMAFENTFLNYLKETETIAVTEELLCLSSDKKGKTCRFEFQGQDLLRKADRRRSPVVSPFCKTACQPSGSE